MAVNNPTTNFGFILPTVDASPGVWDTLLNALLGADSGEAISGIDEVMGDIKTTADAAMPLAGGVFSGEIDVFTERYEAISLSGSGTQTIDMSLANAYYVTPSATITFAFTNVPASGHFAFVQIEITNGAAQTINFPASVDWPGGVVPTWTSGVDLVTGYTRDGGTTWRLAIAMEDSQ